MKDAADIYIRQALKNWAASQHPSPNLRARLLLRAAYPAAQQVNIAGNKRRPFQIQKPLNGTADQFIRFYSLSWVWAIHFTYTPLTRVT